MADAPWNPRDVEAVNNRLAVQHPIDDYYTTSPFPIRLVERRRLAIIREFMGDVAGLDVAEVGSGGGHVLHMFPKARLTAIDVSGVYLDIARRNLAGYDVRYIKGEIDKLDLPARGFDRIICTEVLEHVIDPDAVLGAIGRLLRPSGVAVVTVPNDPLILRLKGLMSRSPIGWVVGDSFNWGGDEYHLHRWSPAEFERLLAQHLQITRRGAAPLDALPLRVCFRCVVMPG